MVLNYKKLALLLVALLTLDFLWIGLVLRRPFTSMVERVQHSKMEFNFVGAVAAYVALFVLAAVFLPRTTSDFEAFVMGSMVYAVYDGTNLATLKDWDLQVALADTAWGGVLFVVLRRLFYV